MACAARPLNSILKLNNLANLQRIGILLSLLAASAYAAEFPVANYGAKGDGQTVDTAAIQKAIDAAAKSSGTVVFKPGVYLGRVPLFLKTGTQVWPGRE